MAKINWSRLLLGGLVAGVVINGISTLLGFWEGPMFEAAMERIGVVSPEPNIGLFVFWISFGFVMGIGSIWVYVAIRPRFGAGVRTALYAGLIVWFWFYLLTFTWLSQSGFFPARLAVHVILTHVVMMCLATVAGAWVYKEE